MQLPNTFGTRGFTLIEVAVVVALIAIVGLVSLNVGTEALPRFFFHSDLDMFGSSLLTSRSEAMNAILGKAHGIHFESDRYTVFSGSSYDSSDQLNEMVPLFPGVSFVESGDIVFEKLSGSVLVPKNISIKSGLLSAELTVNSEGGIEW